jgi:hypothetical protein
VSAFRAEQTTMRTYQGGSFAHDEADIATSAGEEGEPRRWSGRGAHTQH